MLRGTKTDIKNDEGKTPMDLTERAEDENLQRELRKMLGPPGALDCLMLSTPTRKTPKTPKTLLLFALMYLIVQTCEVVCIYPMLPTWACLLQAILVAYNVIMLTVAVCMDPGYIYPTNGNRNEVDFLQLLEVSDST